MPGDARQAALQTRQRTGDTSRAQCDTEQVLIEALFERAILPGIGVGGKALITQPGTGRLARVVVIGEHQHQSRQMHEIRIGEQLTGSLQHSGTLEQ